MTRRMLFAACAAGMLCCLPLYGRTCAPENYGAKADGTTMDTHALQAAIDDCASHGGGHVELKSGTYLSAPLDLKSHVDLHLDQGAVLLGSSNMDDYPVRQDANWRRVALLHADRQMDVSITGSGTIDGSGQPWWEMARRYKKAGDTVGSAGHPRPLLIDITLSKNILIEDVSLRNSPMYNITCFVCNNLTVRGVNIKNPSNAPNTDGIDPFSCDEVLIEDVTIDTGDDDVAIKSGLVERGEPDIPTAHVTIRNSVFLHGHGLSVGSEVAGGVHDLLAENISIDGATNGIRVKSDRGRGNDLYNLSYRNIQIKNVPMPLLITEYYPKIPATDAAQPMGAHSPRFRNISIENVTVTGAKTAGEIVGLPESPVKEVTLKNVQIQAETGMTIRDAQVMMSGVKISPSAGPALIKQAGADVEKR